MPAEGESEAGPAAAGPGRLVCAAVGHGQGASVALVELDLLLAKEGVSAQLLHVRLVPLDRMQLAGRAAAQDRVDATPVARANLDDRLAVGGGEELDRRVDGRVVDPAEQLARQPPKGSGSRREQVGQKGGEEAAPEQVEAEHDEEHLRDAVRCD